MYELLWKIHLFSGLSDADLEQLYKSTEEVRLSAKEELFAEGSVGDRAFIVKEGHLEVLKVSSGNEVSVALLEPGAIIDEMALLKETPRTATVRAQTDTLLLAIRKEQVDQLLRMSPSAAASIRDVTARMRVDEAMADMASFAKMNPAPVLRLDRQGTILLVNPAASEAWGEPDLVGKSWYALCPELEPMALDRMLRGDHIMRHESLVGKRWLLFTYRAVPDRGQVHVYGADITGHKLGEEALADMASFAKMNPAPVLRLDSQGSILLMNPAASELYGEPDLVGKSWYALCPELEPMALEGMLRSQHTIRHESLVGERCFIFTYRAVPDRSQVHVYGADITERKLAEEALQEGEGRFRSLWEHAAEGFFLCELSGKIVDVNQMACNLSGHTREELLNSSVSDISPITPVGGATEWKDLVPGVPFSDRGVIRRKDGTTFPVEVHFTAFETNGRKLIFGSVHDITETRRAEEALRESEIMLRQNEKMAVLGTLTAGIAHDLNNPAAAVKSGAGHLEAAASEFEQAQIRRSRLALTAAQQETLQHLTDQAQLRAAKPPELNALARSEREDELKILLETRGISHPWKHAPALVNLDFDAAGLTALADSFAPDQLPVVVDVLDATYGVYSVLTEIGESAGRISEIVRALKSYSYLDQAPAQAVNVHEGLDTTLLVLGHKLKSGISVRKEYAPHLPNIQANGSELNQVWTNIIDNAADALEGRGEVIIRTPQDHGWVVIEIEDDGPGIPAEIQSRIFEPFFTTKPSGLGIGLGLDISHNIIVEKHQGDIRVLSEPGKTCFEVRLPVTPP